MSSLGVVRLGIASDVTSDNGNVEIKLYDFSTLVNNVSYVLHLTFL